MTEAQALQGCYDLGFDWDGLYAEGRKRLSCYCCPLQRIGELRCTYTHHSDIWHKMAAMDTLSLRGFRPDYTLAELEKRFARERENEEQKSDRT